MSAHLREAWRRLAIGDYATGHQPIDDAPSIDDLTPMFGTDIYDHPEWYSFGYPGEQGAIRVFLSVRGKPNAPVDIYRAQPLSVPSVIESGNWVTTAQAYAEQHIHSNAREGEVWHVIKATVPARTVRNGGSDLIEWGYWGPAVSGTSVYKGRLDWIEP